MRPDPQTESKLFARLVMRGVLPKDRVAALFGEAQRLRDSGQDVTLSALALRAGLIDKDRLLRYFHTGGDELPDVPGYAWVCKLGEGGTADVYRVRGEDGHTEAVKVLKSELSADVAIVRGFVGEADLLKRLEHPNVVKGYRVGRLQGRYMFFMEDVDGPTLMDKIRQGGAFGEDGALFVVLQVARALEYLRGQGLVHRDIKPGNILVTADNTVKVIDLGFAAASAGTGEGAATTSGTAAYLSPEQAMGQTDLDVRSDIYSLGATLYQLVLGELPFAGDDQELVQKAVLEGLSAEATKGGRISAHMHYFIEKMMAKDRDIRYQDPQELMADIEAQISGKKTLEVEEESGGPDEDVAARRRRRIERLRRRRLRG
jgi:eukaryotic-like serine/threonine-protein kinase